VLNNRFEGWYFKHQKDGRTLSLIAGRSRDKAFIQVVTDERSYNIDYPLQDYKKEERLTIAGNVFAKDGIRLDIQADGLTLKGMICYDRLLPLRSDIMGPFRFFPMECRHEVISMSHALSGAVMFNGLEWDFTGGKGYIEGDSGRSFPESYTWLQCNDFEADCSVMVSIARIPFAGLKFWGCLAVVMLGGREYRLATYRGARIAYLGPERLELAQGDYRLVAEIAGTNGYRLHAPQQGAMSRIIHEEPSCRARFYFTRGSKVLLDETSAHASHEFVR
jgi:hypothetical protein